MIIKQTRKLKHINGVLSAPEVSRWSGDDLSPKQLKELRDDSIYLVAEHEGHIVGSFSFRAVGSIELECHVSFKKCAWGATLEAGMMAIDYILANTSARKLSAKIPEDNDRAVFYALRLGFKIEGISRASFLRNGMLINQVYLGLEG